MRVQACEHGFGISPLVHHAGPYRGPALVVLISVRLSLHSLSVLNMACVSIGADHGRLSVRGAEIHGFERLPAHYSSDHFLCSRRICGRSLTRHDGLAALLGVRRHSGRHCCSVGNRDGRSIIEGKPQRRPGFQFPYANTVRLGTASGNRFVFTKMK